MAYAQPIHIGIQLSETCKIMLSENMDTVCPTPEQILSIHPDTSHQNISGQLKEIDGLLQRDKPQMKNSLRYYDYSDTNFIWYDPPGDVNNKIKMIFIYPSLPEYKIQGSYKMFHNTIYTAQDRWINDKCNQASISAEKWTVLLGDTIKLMKNNCDYSESSFNHIKETKFKETVFDISTSYKWQLDNWIKQAKQDCLTLCKEY